MSTSTPQILIPEGFKLYTENQASILLPKNEDTFLNPIQEFNRDLSVACIRTWSEEEDEKKRHKWENKKPKGKGKGKDIATSQDALTDVIGKGGSSASNFHRLTKSLSPKINLHLCQRVPHKRNIQTQCKRRYRSNLRNHKQTLPSHTVLKRWSSWRLFLPQGCALSDMLKKYPWPSM